MKRELWRVSVTTTREGEEAITELLARSFGQLPFSYTEPESDKAIVAAYFERRFRWRPAQKAKWHAGLDRLRSCGLNIGKAKLAVAKIRREDWAQSWKRHFKPIEIGRTLLIRPSWSRRKARRGQAVVELDPGLSFGTGQHPTTAFCLRQVLAGKNGRGKGESRSFLDLGTGSGILAIAAAKLGYMPIEALDFDAAAIRIARANARANRAGARIRFRNQDVAKGWRGGQRRYSLICANLTADALVKHRGGILDRLESSGKLVLAGILDQEFAKVRRDYEAAGLRLLSSRREKEWRSGTFARQ